jgi:hypothetical protein
MNYAKIWANVEDIVIKYVYDYMKYDGKYKHLKESNALVEADLDRTY